MSLHKYFIVIFILLLSGCVVVVNTRGFYSGYKKLTPEEQQKIVFVNEKTGENLCTMNDLTKIYAVTASELLECLNNNQSSLVYIWSPNCSSKSCISLGAAEKYCKENNYSLYVVSEYYDMEKFKLQNNTLPIFSINHLYYKTDFCNKYERLFTEELLQGQKLRAEQKYKRFLIFYRNKFTGVKDSLF